MSRDLDRIGTRRGKNPIAAWPHRRRESLTPAERDRYPTTSILSNSRSRFVGRDSPQRPIRPRELRILRSFHLAARSTHQPTVSIQSFLSFRFLSPGFPFLLFIFYFICAPHPMDRRRDAQDSSAVEDVDRAKKRRKQSVSCVWRMQRG